MSGERPLWAILGARRQVGMGCSPRIRGTRGEQDEGLAGVAKTGNGGLLGGYLPGVVRGHFRGGPSSALLHLDKACAPGRQRLGASNAEGMPGDPAGYPRLLRPDLNVVADCMRVHPTAQGMEKNLMDGPEQGSVGKLCLGDPRPHPRQGLIAQVEDGAAAFLIGF